MSGSEPLYSDLEYGTPRGKGNNNCYAYVLGSYKLNGGIKLQPGNLSHQTSNRVASSCAFLKDRALKDNKARGIYKADPARKCRKGFYKIMSVIDKGTDYHWYVQNGDLLYRMRPGDTLASVAQDFKVPRSSIVARAPVRTGDVIFVKKAGVWSHKQGLATGPLLHDSRGKVIFDPRTASRNYGSLNYRTYCNTFCVKDVPGAMSTQPSPPEARKLRALLHKRVGLRGPRRKKPQQLRRRRAKV
jgi:hypothetical protein